MKLCLDPVSIPPRADFNHGRSGDGIYSIREAHPLKQGLKLQSVTWNEIIQPDSIGTSTKTRIEIE